MGNRDKIQRYDPVTMRMGQGCPYMPGRYNNAHQRRGNKGMEPYALGHFHTALPKPAPEMVLSRKSSVTLHLATEPQEETQWKSISCWEGAKSRPCHQKTHSVSLAGHTWYGREWNQQRTAVSKVGDRAGKASMS